MTTRIEPRATETRAIDARPAEPGQAGRVAHPREAPRQFIDAPIIALSHLDTLWFQVTGTLCNLACTHCFNSSGPNVRTFTFLSPDQVRRELEYGLRVGVREVFFTGGEPFLHPDLLLMVQSALRHVPLAILTNGMLINDRIAGRLAEIEHEARYSLELRISLDSFEPAKNDAIRGNGTFDGALRAIGRLCRHGLMPLITVVRSWATGDDKPASYAQDAAVLAGFTALLRAAGYSRPRIKILPALPLGRELRRTPGHRPGPRLTPDMLDGFDRDLLMCSNSRIVTSRGVWVCPLLVAMPDARLGATLAEAAPAYPLRHGACHSCYRYGTICGNVSGQIEGPAPQPPGEEPAS